MSMILLTCCTEKIILARIGDERYRAAALCVVLVWRQPPSPAESSEARQLCRNQFLLFARLVFHDVPCDGTRGHCKWARQIHLPRAAAPGEIPVLRADDDLVVSGRYTRPRVDTCSATRLNHVRASLLKNVEIPAPDAVLARLLRPELNIELD